jgi:anti-sigma regulatory factor (Ser/Thr protein kinase)
VKEGKVATVELQFGALPLHVRTARLVAAAIARRVGVEESLIDEIKLATGEACSRAVDVHREHAPTELVVVCFSDADDVFTITVLDAGPALEQVAVESSGARPSVGEMLDAEVLHSASAVEPQEDPSSALPSGLGLALIEGLVDDVSIRPRTDGAGTRVSMSWPMLGDLLLEPSEG